MFDHFSKSQGQKRQFAITFAPKIQPGQPGFFVFYRQFSWTKKT
jgi:hypothetical protein